MLPEMKYASSGNVNIAYEVVGHGPIDLVIVHGWVATIEGVRDAPGFAQFVQRLTSFARVIEFVKRGTGMSDRVTQAATMDEISIFPIWGFGCLRRPGWISCVGK